MAEEGSGNPVTLSAEYYRLLLENAAVALVATDAEFNVVAWNAAAGDLLGAPARERIGRPILQAVPENRRKLLQRLLERTAKRGLTSEFQVRLPAPSGQARHLLVILSPVPDMSGRQRADSVERSQGVAAWILDETNRRRLSDRLAQAERMASLGTLAAGVAHHFNNILGGVGTMADFAITGGDPDAMRRALQMTAEATARAAKITQALLSFAEPDRGKEDLADLTEVVLTFAHLSERPLNQRNIRLHLDLKPVPVVPVEASRMHLALGNLLTNAEEAMPEGGTVSISLERKDSDVVLTFADTGCGIKPEHLPLIFEPFFTSKGLLSGGDRANPGLGLSVVHGMILEMGGRIEVRSAPGRGTEFFIHLPVPRGKGVPSS